MRSPKQRERWNSRLSLEVCASNGFAIAFHRYAAQDNHVILCSSAFFYPTNGTEPDGTPETLDATKPTSKAKKLRQLRLKKKQSSPAITQRTQEDYVRNAVDEYLQASFEPKLELKNQCKRMGKYTASQDDDIDWHNLDDALYPKYMPDIDWDKVNDFDILYISSKFDLLEWWKNVGSKKHPLVILVALVILTLPPTNAYQERIFSTCTYFDDPLRQNLKFSRFEMSVLLAVNQAFLRNRIPSFEEVKSIVERVIAMFEKDASIVDAADELGFDVDAENFEAEPED